MPKWFVWFFPPLLAVGEKTITIGLGEVSSDVLGNLECQISFTLKRHNLIPPTYCRELLDTCRNTNSYRLHSRTPEALGLAGLHTSIGCLVVVLRNSCFASPVLCTLKHGNTLDIVYCLILLMKFLSFISKKKVLFKSIYFLFNKKKID